MQVTVIKHLVANHDQEELLAAEEALLEGETPAIPVDGEDEGEQLTHVMAALWVQRDMSANSTPVGKSIRNYTQKVRNSIS